MTVTEPLNIEAFLDGIVLKHGNHKSPDDGFCVMEATAYIAREDFSDHPACVSPVIGAFMRRWNDDLDNETRQKLKPYAAKVIGTNTGKADDNKRTWLVTDWLVRVYTPAWLDLAGCNDQATALRGLPAITSAAIAKKSQPTIDEARDIAQAANSAAWSAANSAARSAAESAARSAAYSAAESAAWAAAESAAESAARAAAYSTAEDVLNPTVVSLHQSAFELLDELIDVGK